MAERDRFELDLAAALRAYLDEAPTQARPTELARQFAGAYPHRRAALGRWSFGPAPALAWLLLLAGLLVVLVGGALIAGSQLRRSLPALVPPIDQLYKCPPGSTPDKPGPVHQAGPPEGDTGMAFDRRAGRLVAVTSAGGTWTFDVCTNIWIRMHPAAEPPGGAQLVYDSDSDQTILVSPGGSVWAYNLQADTWTENGKAPVFGPSSDYPFLAYDPATGLVILAGAVDGSLSMWTYEVESDQWTPIRQANAGPDVSWGGATIAYDASVDRIVACAGTARALETWLFDLRTGLWSRSGAPTPGVVAGLFLPIMVYDEAVRLTVIWANAGAAGYDASTDRWSTLVEADPRTGFWLDFWTPGFQAPGGMPGPMLYDAVNGRLVGPGPHYDSAGYHVGRAGVLAFDSAARQWTVLLEPGER